jgi:phospholipid/cholesterol/gamma-HCH transport system permease protein
MLNPALRAVGRQALGPVEYTFELFFMVYLSLRAVVLDPSQGLRSILNVVLTQIYFTGVQALPLISVLALAAGSIVTLQTSLNLGLLGGGSAIGTVMVAVVVREIAPLLTALIVIARSGTAVASELGMMQVNREVEALESMGIHPLSYVVFPRLLGGVVSVVCLAVFFVAVAVAGGFAVANCLQSLPLPFYLDSLLRAFSRQDVALFLIKNLFSGMIIFVVSCHQGLAVRQSPHEVPQVTTKAVVSSIIYVVVFNLTVTILFYMAWLMKWGVHL